MVETAGKFLKGASVLATSQLLIALCTFFRNIIVARLVSVEDYGIATIFALTVSLIEMSGNLAFDVILVQDKHGNSDDMLASAHLMQWIKSVFLALVLFVAAEPVALMFGLPEQVWAFRLLAMIPFIKGFTHFDTVVQQREMKYAATAYMDAIPQLIVVAAAYPVARWLGDYRVMLVIVLAQTMISVLLSHVLASRPYRWTLQKELARKKLAFGWPLLVNGLLMFAIFQADKAIIGAHYNMATLGWYGAAFALTLMPTLLFAKVSGFLLMPTLSRNRENEERFLAVGLLALVLCTVVAVFLANFFTIGGAAFIGLSYGQKYLPGSTVIAWLGLMQALRVVRVAPTIMATAQADTRNSMYANVVRSVALVLALVFAYYDMPVQWIAVSGVIGEVFALAATLYLLRMPRDKAVYINKVLYLLAVASLLCVLPYFIVPQPSLDGLYAMLNRLGMAVAVSGSLALLLILSDRNMRLFLSENYRRRARKAVQ